MKPGDGSAREQAASRQKVLGGWANIANDYATKRYRSNLINWGMLPLHFGKSPFANGDYIFPPDILEAVKKKESFTLTRFGSERPGTEKTGEGGDSGKMGAPIRFTVRLGDLYRRRAGDYRRRLPDQLLQEALNRKGTDYVQCKV